MVIHTDGDVITGSVFNSSTLQIDPMVDFYKIGVGSHQGTSYAAVGSFKVTPKENENLILGALFVGSSIATVDVGRFYFRVDTQDTGFGVGNITLGATDPTQSQIHATGVGSFYMGAPHPMMIKSGTAIPLLVYCANADASGYTGFDGSVIVVGIGYHP